MIFLEFWLFEPHFLLDFFLIKVLLKKACGFRRISSQRSSFPVFSCLLLSSPVFSCLLLPFPVFSCLFLSFPLNKIIGTPKEHRKLQRIPAALYISCIYLFESLKIVLFLTFVRYQHKHFVWQHSTTPG